MDRCKFLVYYQKIENIPESYFSLDMRVCFVSNFFGTTLKELNDVNSDGRTGKITSVLFF